MARPRKRRRICGLPQNNRYGPLGMEAGKKQRILMSLDQYETIRLIDLEGMTQAECAEQMHIARTTVQRIYSKARKILADSIVNGKAITIEGGDYRICDGYGKRCRMPQCNK